MLRIYDSAVTYVLRERSALGDEDIASTREAQIMHILEALPTLERDVDDSSALMAKLTVEEHPDDQAFTTDQKRRIAKAVSTHMKGLTQVDESSTKNQSHQHVHHWLSNAQWDKFWSKDVSDDEKRQDWSDIFLGSALGTRMITRTS